jgi:hypothetical protein
LRSILLARNSSNSRPPGCSLGHLHRRPWSLFGRYRWLWCLPWRLYNAFSLVNISNRLVTQWGVIEFESYSNWMVFAKRAILHTLGMELSAICSCQIQSR